MERLPMKLCLIVFSLILVLPLTVNAKDKKHIKTAEDQECYECHGTQMQVWQDGKHGLMNVKCVVCHGSTDKNFVSKPDIYKCRGCHGDKVSDVEKKLPLKLRDCFLCHDHHSVTPKFHTKGGK
ncbi:hypothetical protein JZK55_08310 [Dissulfurispira thermophila]|uniref:Cytochrome c-552/4 domain-containing protein n=2 Tax=root TaxID=1 RepID=A0A7G1H0W1_9BACT|nr:multiheme c-type cytochrome [Dissulfurispira thermophila]BCB95909.1 hypothetical protein JZK55_08310 [Dissulfurispira thermophila]